MEFTCKIKVVDFGSLKALVTVNFGDMEIRGFKVIESGEGLWIGMPSREIMKEGHKEYFDIVRFQDNEARKRFSDLLISEYCKAVGMKEALSSK